MPRRNDYLVLIGSKYSFRLTVPAPLHGVLGRTAFKEALGTGDYETARRKAARLRVKREAEIEAGWALIKARGENAPRWVGELDDRDLWDIASRWFIAKEQGAAKLTAMDVNVADRLEELGWLSDVDEGTSALASVHNITKKLLLSEGIQPDPSSRVQKRLVGWMHEAMLEHEKRIIARFSAQPVQLNPSFAGLTSTTDLSSPGHAVHASTSPSSETPLLQVVARWAKERKCEEKTLDTYEARLCA